LNSLYYEINSKAVLLKTFTNGCFSFDSISWFFNRNDFNQTDPGEEIMTKVDNCTTCGTNLVESGSVRLPCPKCGEGLGRCQGCRVLANTYECPKCGFVGP